MGYQGGIEPFFRAATKKVVDCNGGRLVVVGGELGESAEVVVDASVEELRAVRAGEVVAGSEAMAPAGVRGGGRPGGPGACGGLPGARLNRVSTRRGPPGK